MTYPGHPAQQPPHQPGVPQPPYPPHMAGQPLPGFPVAPPKQRRWLIPALIGGAVTVVLCCGGVLAIGAASDPKPTGDAAKAPAADVASATSAAAAPGLAATPPAAPPTSAAAPKPAPSPSKTGPTTYRVGQSVRGGDFQFVVHQMKCGISQVGSSYLNTKAQGMFCRADISVKNMTKSAHTFHADGTVTTQDGAGREYSTDGEANIYGNKSGAGFLDEINPGNSIRAYVYFDVPKGTKLTTVTFDAGLFTFAEDAIVTL